MLSKLFCCWGGGGPEKKGRHLPKVTQQVRELELRPPRVPGQVSGHRNSFGIPCRPGSWSGALWGKGQRERWFQNLHRDTSADGFALTLLSTFHSGAHCKLFRTEFKTRHSCLPPEEQLAVLALHEKFSGLLWVSSTGPEAGPRAPLAGARGFCPSREIHIAVLQTFQFLPSSQRTHSLALAWPQVHPLSCQHLAKPSHISGFCPGPREALGSRKETVE